MTALREAAQQALEALDVLCQRGVWGDFHGVADSLRAALADPQEPDLWGAGYEAGYAAGMKDYTAEPVQEPDVPATNFGSMEPVGWLENPFGSFRRNWLWKLDPPPQTLAWSIPLYTAPPQRKPLAEWQISDQRTEP